MCHTYKNQADSFNPETICGNQRFFRFGSLAAIFQIFFYGSSIIEFIHDEVIVEHVTLFLMNEQKKVLINSAVLGDNNKKARFIKSAKVSIESVLTIKLFNFYLGMLK